MSILFSRRGEFHIYVVLDTSTLLAGLPHSFVYELQVSDTGMVAHLSASHGDNLIFKAARNEVGEVSIALLFALLFV